MHDRVNILGLLSLERSAYKIGPWLASEKLDFGIVPTISKPIRVVYYA